MSVFEYRALKPDGSIAEGNIEAGGRQEVFRQLDQLGFSPVEITERAQSHAERRPHFQLSWKSKKVSFSALENFTRQLSSLLSAGVALSRALRIVCREASSHAAREKWKEVHDLVIDGASLGFLMQSWDRLPSFRVAKRN
jgi:type II secretory pathway component PulF